MPINYKSYPRDWFTRIVPAVRARSNDHCEECGLKNRSVVWSVPVKRYRGHKLVYHRIWIPVDPKLISPQVKEVTIILTVAHLDNDSWNHHVTIDRLKHLCQRCHLRMDAKYKAVKRSCHAQCDWPSCQFVSCFRKSLHQPLTLHNHVNQL